MSEKEERELKEYIGYHLDESVYKDIQEIIIKKNSKYFLIGIVIGSLMTFLLFL